MSLKHQVRIFWAPLTILNRLPKIFKLTKPRFFHFFLFMNPEIVLKIQEMLKIDPVAHSFMTLFLKRENGASVTKVETIMNHFSREGLGFKKVSVVKLMKELEKVGCGRFLAGRRGHPSRFEWSIDAVELAPVVLAAPTDGVSAPIKKDQDPANGTSASSPLDLLNHAFNLRPRFTVTIDLPVDFSKLEAQRLARFIESLPMSES